jgi:hypothetical protein
MRDVKRVFGFTPLRMGFPLVLRGEFHLSSPYSEVWRFFTTLLRRGTTQSQNRLPPVGGRNVRGFPLPAGAAGLAPNGAHAAGDADGDGRSR